MTNQHAVAHDLDKLAERADEIRKICLQSAWAAGSDRATVLALLGSLKDGLTEIATKLTA